MNPFDNKMQIEWVSIEIKGTEMENCCAITNIMPVLNFVSWFFYQRHSMIEGKKTIKNTTKIVPKVKQKN